MQSLFSLGNPTISGAFKADSTGTRYHNRFTKQGCVPSTFVDNTEKKCAHFFVCFVWRRIASYSHNVNISNSLNFKSKNILKKDQ